MNDFRDYDDYLMHFGVLGMKWGIRRYQNPDGTLTEEGKKHYIATLDNMSSRKEAYKNKSDKYSINAKKYRAKAEKYARGYFTNRKKEAKYLNKAGTLDMKAYKNLRKSEKLNKQINSIIKTLNVQGYTVTSNKQYNTNKRVIEVFDKFDIKDIKR